jgi:hypothetical protein
LLNPHKIRREVQPTNGLRAAIAGVELDIHHRAAVSNRWLRQVGGAQCLEAAGGGVGEGALAEVNIAGLTLMELALSVKQAGRSFLISFKRCKAAGSPCDTTVFVERNTLPGRHQKQHQ